MTKTSKYSVKLLTWDQQGHMIAVRYASVSDKDTTVRFAKEFWSEFHDPQDPKKYRKQLIVHDPDGNEIKNHKNFDQ